MSGAIEESKAVYNQSLIRRRASPQDRAWALVGLENLYRGGRADTAAAGAGTRFRARALKVRPSFLHGPWFNLANLEKPARP